MSTALFVAILAVSSLVTSFISGILGMAGGLILMGILMAMMSVPAAMMMHGITQFASNAWRAFLWRTYVDWKIIRGYFYGSFAMLLLFAVTQLVLSKPLALIAMGLTPFLALALPESLHLNVERKGHASACGLICTVLSLTAGVSGPILDIFFVRSAMTRHAVVATKAMTQSLSHLMKIGYFGGVLTVGRGQVEPLVGVMMVVLALVGTTLSTRVLEKMNDKSFRMWTRRVVMTIGTFYLASGILLLYK
jgi:uncharacterized membrane protein YfcA